LQNSCEPENNFRLNRAAQKLAEVLLLATFQSNRTQGTIDALMPRKTTGHGHDTRYVRLQKNHCFGCGTNNPDGMRLRFTYDEERNCFVCRFRLGKRYTGPPGHCHGGIIATILDEAMGKVNKLRHVIALTKEIKVEYRKPVPLYQPLRVESREVRVSGRKHTNMAEILNEKGEVLASSEGLFIAVDPQRLMAKLAEG
jgi:uncharacterized protein (TIGR00369 family)